MAIVLNHDIAGVCRRINHFIIELQFSVSGGVAEVTPFDQERLQSYLSAVRSYRDWVIAQPQLDLSKTHPRNIEVGPDPETDDVENESVRDIVYMLELCRDELVKSPSASMPAGFNVFDDKRAMALITKVQNFLDKYVKVVTPLDLPESTPVQPLTGPGAITRPASN